MRQQLVYDWPTRIFHWLFAGLFLIAFMIAKMIDDDSIWFSYHSLAGLTLGFVVLFRILWGFVGTRHARFVKFALNPKDLLSYFKGILSGDKRRWAGHNPASSWAAIAMMFMAIGLSVTGYLMTSGPNKETFEDVHELLANGFIVVTVLHVAGIVLHTLRHNEMIGLSMIDEKKTEVTVDETITNSKPAIGILFVGLAIFFGIYLFKNFDSPSRSLQFFGSTLQIGENEESGRENSYQGDED